MPISESATPAALLELLSGTEAESREAWTAVRERLREEPDALAPALCEVVLASLENGHALPVRSAILPAVEAETRDHPEVVPQSVLDRLLQRAAELDTLSVLCLAAMRVRADAEGFVTDGIQEVLAATEHALLTPDDPEQRDVQEYAREVAYDLWETVADRDPGALVVILEFWTAAAGWDRPASRLLAELLLRVARHRADIRDATIDALEAARRSLPPTAKHRAELETILAELHRLRERARRKHVARHIVDELRPDISDAHDAPAPPSVSEPLDSETQLWLDDYLSDDVDRATRAHERLGPREGEPQPATIAGVTRALEELLATDARDERLGPLLDFLCNTAERRPDLVPTELLERCARTDGLEEWERAMAFATLVRVRPNAVFRRLLPDAFGTAVVVGGALGAAILAGIGRVDPGFLLAFAREWLQSEGWTEEVGPALACAFEQVAAQQPDQVQAMVRLLRQHTAVPPTADSTETPPEVVRCLERLASLAAGDGV